MTEIKNSKRRQNCHEIQVFFGNFSVVFCGNLGEEELQKNQKYWENLSKMPQN